MRVLLINKYLFPKGGDASITFSTGTLLQEKGNEVYYWGMDDPRNMKLPYSEYFVPGVDYYAEMSLPKKFKTALQIIYSFQAKNQLAKLLALVKPDIIHLHNIAHQISPSILHTIKKKHIPVVMTLHDFKLVCPYWYLMRKGNPCEQCKNRRYFWCFIHRCTMDSYGKSFINMLEMYVHHTMLHIYSLVDVFIAPSRFLITKIHEMGYHRRIYLLNNFLDLREYPPAPGDHGEFICYFGRISPEKGLHDLVNAVKNMDIHLKIIGSGRLFDSLKDTIQKEDIKNIELPGYMEKEVLLREVRKSIFVVLPSRCYENSPVSIMEAFASGKPVVGARTGGIPELVKDHETGLTFESGNSRDLGNKIQYLLRHPAEIIRMGKNAREWAERVFNPDDYYEGLNAVYRKAMETK